MPEVKIPFSVLMLSMATFHCLAAAVFSISRSVAAISRIGVNREPVDVLPPVLTLSIGPVAVLACSIFICSIGTSNSSAAIMAKPVKIPCPISILGDFNKMVLSVKTSNQKLSSLLAIKAGNSVVSMV